MNGYLLRQGVDHSRLIELAFDGRCFLKRLASNYFSETLQNALNHKTKKHSQPLIASSERLISACHKQSTNDSFKVFLWLILYLYSFVKWSIFATNLAGAHPSLWLLHHTFPVLNPLRPAAWCLKGLTGDWVKGPILGDWFWPVTSECSWTTSVSEGNFFKLLGDEVL